MQKWTNAGHKKLKKMEKRYPNHVRRWYGPSTTEVLFEKWRILGKGG